MNEADKPKEQLISHLAALRGRIAELEVRETELKQAEGSLTRLASFPEQNPNPVIETDLEGKVTYLNPMSRERFPDLEAAGLQHPILDGLESTIRTLREADEDSVLRELQIGDYTYEQKTTFMAQNNLVRIFAYDITELKRSEASLTRLASFPEQNPNPVIETDLEGEVTYLNPVARERFPDLEAVGLQHPTLEGLESTIRILQEAEEDSILRELQIGEYTYEQKTTYMAQNNLVRIFAYDITELKRLQQQLQDSLGELEETNRHLQATQVQLVQSEKMAAMANLVAGIVHEINTPMGAITSVHDTLSRAVEKLRSVMADELPHGQQHSPKINSILHVIADSGNVIKTGSERVTSMIQSMRNFARLDEAELKRVDIHDGIEDTLRLVQHDLENRIEIIRNYGDIQSIVCYPGRLNQVFLCLLVNALEAIKDTGQIAITTQQVDDNLHVSIRDTGVGIPEGNFERIFDPGFTTKGVGVGTGLGLSICHQIVQDHKGRFQVESKVGQGSTFTAILPYSFSGFMLR